jgi:site-specific recombinase XerD
MFSTFLIAERPTSRKLLDVYRDALRVKHYSPRTEDTYAAWVKNFILFHNKRHPREMGVDEIGQFLTHLAAEKDVSASTQNQAFSATLRVFLYRHTLQIELDEAALARFRPRRARTVPTVLSKEEVKRLLANLTGTPKLIAQVMYGGGLRVTPALACRCKCGDHAAACQRY